MTDIDRLADAIRDEPGPDGFADRVMDALPPPESRWLRLWDSPFVQAVVWTAASILIAVRLGSTLALFLG